MNHCVTAARGRALGSPLPHPQAHGQTGVLRGDGGSPSQPASDGCGALPHGVTASRGCSEGLLSYLSLCVSPHPLPIGPLESARKEAGACVTPTQCAHVGPSRPFWGGLDPSPGHGPTTAWVCVCGERRGDSLLPDTRERQGASRRIETEPKTAKEAMTTLKHPGIVD